jgi:hypothetical protein
VFCFEVIFLWVVFFGWWFPVFLFFYVGGFVCGGLAGLFCGGCFVVVGGFLEIFIAWYMILCYTINFMWLVI